jgi:hypothetical protein
VPALFRMTGENFGKLHENHAAIPSTGIRLGGVAQKRDAKVFVDCLAPIRPRRP